MGRFLFVDLETVYFGGGRDVSGARGVLGFLGAFCLSAFVVLAVPFGAAQGGGGATPLAFLGLVGLLSARGCLEGRTGLSSGGCALSASVRDSAAARSAARWAAWGDNGCLEEALGGLSIQESVAI